MNRREKFRLLFEGPLRSVIEPTIREELKHERARQGALALPLEGLVEKRCLEVMELVERIVDELQAARKKALDLLFKELSASPEEIKEIERELDELLPWIERRQEELLLSEKEAPEEAEEQEPFPLSEKTLGTFYRVGRILFEQERFEEAGSLFLFLVYLFPEKSFYWLAYGHCLYNQKRHEEALFAYAVASSADPSNPEPRIFSAKIYFELEEPEEAFLELKECEKLASEEGGGKWSELLQEIKQAM